MSNIVNQNGFPTVNQPMVVSPPVDRSRASVSNITAYPLMIANSSRLGYEFYNNGPTRIAINSVGGTASFEVTDGNGSIILEPGAYYVPPYVSTAAVSVISDLPDGVLTANEW